MYTAVTWEKIYYLGFITDNGDNQRQADSVKINPPQV